MSDIKEGLLEFEIPVFPIKQPIGSFFIGVMGASRLCEITDFDVRRLIREREFETYLGIQRPLDKKRVKEIQRYVETVDACFPAGVILSVSAKCATYNKESRSLKLSNYIDEENPEQSVFYRAIARVIDGQHRIEGLKHVKQPDFQVGVSIFIGIDVAEEAYIFSTVNLAQTKVNRSLATDLFDLAHTKSPQKLCHNVAVTLDKEIGSPFYHRIKRLGVATEGRFDETITQATVYDMLMPYLSKDPIRDRDCFMRHKQPERASSEELRKLLFRNMFLDGQELEIVDILWHYFEAVSRRWPEAWNSNRRGMILNKTNGFRALMRFLRPVYLAVAGTIGRVPSTQEFGKIFQPMGLGQDDFNSELFLPGTSGEAQLLKEFKRTSGLGV